VDVAAARTETGIDKKRVIRHLRELINALDSRVPHLERRGETQIVGDATALRVKAIKRIAQLDRKQ